MTCNGINQTAPKKFHFKNFEKVKMAFVEDVLFLINLVNWTIQLIGALLYFHISLDVISKLWTSNYQKILF